MQEIAEHDERVRAGPRDQCAQPFEIRCGRAARYGHATGTKRGGLAQMHVRDEQRPFAGTVQRARSEQLDALTTDLRGQTMAARRAGRIACGAKRQRGGGHLQVAEC